MNDALRMFVIYERPRDAPDHFVVREWVITAGVLGAKRNAHAMVSSLEEARRSVPDGLVRTDRRPEDDSCIVEIWL